ncbi:MAG: hydrogenase maturation protease [Candidatus Promineifilaceae bacterium]
MRDLLPDLPPRCLLLEVHNAPESYTGPIRRFEPDLVLFVDVAWLGEAADTLALIEWQDTAGLSASTHTFSLHLLAKFLNHELGCDVLLLGLQPRDMELGASLSPPVESAVSAAAAGLADLLA